MKLETPLYSKHLGTACTDTQRFFVVAQSDHKKLLLNSPYLGQKDSRTEVVFVPIIVHPLHIYNIPSDITLNIRIRLSTYYDGSLSAQIMAWFKSTFMTTIST